MTTQTATTPHLYRCRTCLETYAFETRSPFAEPTACACGHKTWKYIGQVNGGRVIYSATAPACNYMCTDAVGKSCDCQCGGLNHGTHRTRNIRRDLGATPTLENPDEDACRLRAHEFTAALAALRTRLIETIGLEAFEGWQRGAWIDRGAWDQINDWVRTVNAAWALNSHAGRMKRLAAA